MFVASALHTKKAQPAVLSLIYYYVARELGLNAHGLALPGHFFVGVFATPERMDLIDVFHAGRVLSVLEAVQLSRDTLGKPFDYTDAMLAPVTNRAWITRISQNLIDTCRDLGDWIGVTAMIELQLLLWPKQLQLHRDLGLVLARQAEFEAAENHLGYYLEQTTDGPEQTDSVRQLLSQLRRQRLPRAA